MTQAKPVDLESKYFLTQRDAVSYFRKMLNSYRPKECISNEDGRDLIALLARHPKIDIDIGVGINHFEVIRSERGARCFCLVRLDGTRKKFSYLDCIYKFKEL